MPSSNTRSFRIYLGFARASYDDLGNLCLGVSSGLTDNPVFTTADSAPPVSPTQLTALYQALKDAATNARNGGSDRTRAKKAAAQAVADALVKDALYCQGIARYNLDDLLSSGFDVVSTNRTSRPLDQPRINDILNDVSGQLTVRGQGVLNGRMYKARISKDNGVTWVDAGTFNGARRMVLTGLISGTLYMVEICALGGSTGQSPWSNPASKMVT